MSRRSKSNMITKYDRIGLNYNLTRKADKYISDRFVHHLKVKTNKEYLDLGCGTGNYAIELYRRGIMIKGVDPSEKMLHEAMSKENQIDWLLGTAEKICIDDESVNGIMGCLTIHHWANLPVAFNEMNRVLTENGRFVFFTATPDQMRGYWLNHYFPNMLKESIYQMPSLEFLENELSSAGFQDIQKEKYYISKDLEDCFLYSGKHDPYLYMKCEIRNGISSFADLANKEEIENGLKLLKNDLESGRFDMVKDGYKNDLGDYLFISGTKTQY